jgi:hypothetical protein
VLKVLIFVLLIGVIVSLFSGLVFLFKDAGKQNSRRTLHALGVRITLAAALLATIFYGFYTGQLRLGTNAPWHTTQQSQAAPEDGTRPD